jgi:outer membrane protein TolC
VPAALLANRPDLQQAELSLRGTFEDVNAARAYFYPSVTLSANAGVSSRAIDVLLHPASAFANLVGGLAQPIFDKNVNRARLAGARAKHREADAAFRQALLTAAAEVSTTLFRYQRTLTTIDLRNEQIESLRNATTQTEELLRYGSGSYIDVLTAQQSLLAAELSLIDHQAARLLSVVDLYQALGGGWRNGGGGRPQPGSQTRK